MRPTPIPDDEVWAHCERKVILPPDGDMTNEEIESAEAVRGIMNTQNGETPFHAFRIVLEDGDLERLQKGEPIWIVQIAPFVVPFCMVFRDEAIQEESGDPV